MASSKPHQRPGALATGNATACLIVSENYSARIAQLSVVITRERSETFVRYHRLREEEGHARACVDACGAEAGIQAFRSSWIPA
jgi:ribosomal protein L22